MKSKDERTSLSKKKQNKTTREHGGRQKAWRRIRLQLVAVFLVIVFLASECVALLPVE